MAIYNGRILMRKGNEADFDASKLLAGEWAVSLDAGIVRIGLEAGKIIRMATYEAFEKDMEQIEEILLSCQTIEQAVTTINTQVSANANACADYVVQAKTYRDEAESFKNEAKTFRNEAESFKNQAGEIVGIGIATTEKAGIVKPDGTSITVDADGTIHSIGGSGGTSNYNDLTDKPKINGVELVGDLSTDDLNINAGASDYVDLTNKPSINGIELSGNKTTADLNIKEGTTNYTELNNKPTINGVELSGALTSDDLKIKAGDNAVNLTQAEYDALDDSKLTDNIEYRITDAGINGVTASNVSYDNASSGLEAVTVQKAVDKLKEETNGLHNSLGGLYESLGGFINTTPILELERTVSGNGTYNYTVTENGLYSIINYITPSGSTVHDSNSMIYINGICLQQIKYTGYYAGSSTSVVVPLKVGDVIGLGHGISDNITDRQKILVYKLF